MSNTNINYTHDHVFLGSAHDENAKRTLWVVALTVLMMVGEITAGYITGSMALLADGFHMATHAGALGIAAAAYGYAKRHASSERYSFGTGKVGDLGGFASALVLGMVSWELALSLSCASCSQRKFSSAPLRSSRLPV
jgi:Co/Zn/Cd efflux system component